MKQYVKRGALGLVLLVMPLLLSGCTLNQGWMSFSTTTNSADTGEFSKVTVINNKKKSVYYNAKVYPYNNGGDDSTGGRLEVRHDGVVTVVPNNAQVDLEK